MQLYSVLGLYALIFLLTVLFFTRYLSKNYFLSFLAALIVGQMMLIFLSCFGLFEQTSSSTTSTELIFWSINLITPFVVYIALLYIIYTRDIE
jgi:hypothetical protein